MATGPSKNGVRKRAPRGRCQRARGLNDLGLTAVSPGGGSIYVVSPDALGIFRRTGTGALRQLRGRAGCLNLNGTRGCARARALRDLFTVVVSPDGRNVYAGSPRLGTILSFARDPKTGALRQLHGRAGCLSGMARSGCGVARGLGSVSDLVLGPGGRFLYAATGAGIAAFRREARTGRLDQLQGNRGCLSAEQADGCAPTHALGVLSELAVDPDGDNLYASAGPIGIFDLAASAPAQLAGAAGCIGHLGEGGCTAARTLQPPNTLAASPDGAHLYVASQSSGAVAVLARDRVTAPCLNRLGRSAASAARAASPAPRPGTRTTPTRSSSAVTGATPMSSPAARSSCSAATARPGGSRNCRASAAASPDTSPPACDPLIAPTTAA